MTPEERETLAAEQRRINTAAIKKLASEHPMRTPVQPPQPSKPQPELPKSVDDAVPITPRVSTATLQHPPVLAREPSILAAFRDAVVLQGVVGEIATAQLEYLVITSRLLGKPVSAAVKGLSSSGKSFTTQKTVEFFPKEAVIEMTAMSERALVYSKEEYAHRTLILYEAEALREKADDNLTSYFVRSLLSEGRIEYPVTVRDKKGGFTTKTIVKEGPTGLILTTTKTRVHTENETRLLSVTTNDTPVQTRAIFRALASERAPSVDLSVWHDLQRWLQTAEHRVTIPYARQLAELVPPVAVRLRRDFGMVLSLVKAHVILHQVTRERDSRGCIVATLADYDAVRELVADLVAEGVGRTVAETVRETVEAVSELAGDDGAGATKIATGMRLDKGTVSRRLRRAADGGYIRNLETKRGQPGRWIIGEPLPEAVAVLPPVEMLKTALAQAQQGVCRFASTKRGVKADGSLKTALDAIPDALIRDGCGTPSPGKCVPVGGVKLTDAQRAYWALAGASLPKDGGDL